MLGSERFSVSVSECFWPDWQLGQSWEITCHDKHPSHVHTNKLMYCFSGVEGREAHQDTGSISIAPATLEMPSGGGAKKGPWSWQALGAGHANSTENVRHPNNLDNGTRAHTPCLGNRMWHTPHTQTLRNTCTYIHTHTMTHKSRQTEATILLLFSVITWLSRSQSQ